LKILSFFPHFSDLAQLHVSLISSDISPKLDLSIDGMRSQQFSEGVFVFLMLGIAVFSGIVFVLGFGKSRLRLKGARMGELAIIGVIIIGIVAAVIMAAMQMLGGYLF
jgi:hypothetical protein